MNTALLRQFGMTVAATDQPMDVAQILVTFPAEVLVLDMYMPQCSGPELAAALRDDQHHAAMPVIYLSAETNVSKQLLALGRGGDYLRKPIDPAHLEAVVSLHARRHRQARDLAASEKAAQYEKERQQQALNAHAIVSATDTAGNILYVNDKFCEISGYRREELIGQNHRLLKSGEHPDAFYEDMWRSISSGKIWAGEVCNRHKDGTLYWVESSIVPFLDATGLPYQYISIRTDITGLMKTEQSLRESEERLIFAVEGAGDGIWDWNLATGAMSVSAHYEPMLGYDKGELSATIDAWVTSVHADDLARVQQSLQDYLAGKAPAYVVELRLRCKHGGYKWVLCRGTVVARDAAGQAMRMIGIHSDITEQKVAEVSLKEARQAA